MSLVFAEHTGIPAHSLQSRFDCLYDKYGPAIYGFMSGTVNVDKDMAGKMLAKVFIAWQTHKDANSNDFIQLLQLAIGVMNKEGYLPCLPLLHQPKAELERLG